MLDLIAHGLRPNFFCTLLRVSHLMKKNNPTFSSFTSIDYKQKLNILKDLSLKQLEDVLCPKLSLGNISNSKTRQQPGICFFRPNCSGSTLDIQNAK